MPFVAGTHRAAQERDSFGFRWFWSAQPTNPTVTPTFPPGTLIQGQHVPRDHPAPQLFAGVQGPNVAPPAHAAKLVQAQYVPHDHPTSRLFPGIPPPSARAPVIDTVILKQEIPDYPRHPLPRFATGVQGPNVRSPVRDVLVTTQELPDYPRHPRSHLRPSLPPPNVKNPITDIIRTVQERPPQPPSVFSFLCHEFHLATTTIEVGFGITASAQVQPAPIPPPPVPSAPLYKPPTRVVTRDQPYLALVSAADPMWQRLKYREVQYEFSDRRILFNPYVGGAYNNYSNVYPVGAQQGPVDPLLSALAATNIGAVAVVGQQSISLPRPSSAKAGNAIILVVVDGSGGGAVRGDAFSDGANNYKVLRSFNQGAGIWVHVAWSYLSAALPSRASISYASPGTIGPGTAIAMAGVLISGGVQPTVFDPDVLQINFGNGSSPTVVSGEPQQSSELFVGLCVAGANVTFTPDGAHDWMSPQQAAAGTGSGVALFTSAQTGPLFDPGTNPMTIFSPRMSIVAPWTAIVLGILGNKPMYTSSADGKGWA